MRSLVLVCLGGILCATTARSQTTQWPTVDSIFGRQGTSQAGDVMRYSFPRSDLDVTANGVRLKPAFALGSWVAFMGSGSSSVAAGDLVLLEKEVAPVMRTLQRGGVEQTALHNHVLGESPRIMYMHIMAHGDPMTIARTVHDALAATGTPRTASPPAAPGPLDLDTAAISAALGYHGRINGGVYQVSVPRAEQIVEQTMTIPPSMGVATAINFQPTGGGKAAITGDFVMTGAEVNPVIRALESAGIQATAIHSHMLDESPRLFFMHFWANDNAVSLAKGLSAALKQMHNQGK